MKRFNDKIKVFVQMQNVAYCTNEIWKTKKHKNWQWRQMWKLHEVTIYWKGKDNGIEMISWSAIRHTNTYIVCTTESRPLVLWMNEEELGNNDA
jgi:hypothetical protein